MALVKANQLMPKPAHLTWEEAAVNGLCASTSYRMLVGRHAAQMKQGDSVFVWGATGGIGGYAVQYVLNGGGTPVGVVSRVMVFEYFHSSGLDLVRSRLGLRAPFPQEYPTYLLLEMSGGSAEEVAEAPAEEAAAGEPAAEEAPAEADVVIPVPDSGMMAAIGYSQRSGIPYAEGLIKNRYVGRTFIQPTDGMRQLGIRLKLNPLPSVIEGNRVVVVDDSIVRGNTSRKLVELLFEAGAAEVHFRVSSPPVKGPCYYGIDMDSPDQLVGANLTVEEIRAQIGATTLAYLSTDAMVAATQQRKDRLCRACFDGDYPTTGTASKFALENRTQYAASKGG
jgi:adenine/guanine phosphoribosyltransferase-like PRPP-binding protein